jgi:hypothetical protein
VRVDSPIDLDWLRATIAQLIGEAAARHTAGETFALPRAVWDLAKERQEVARSESDTETLLADWFAETPFSKFAYVTCADLAKLAGLAGWRASHTTRGKVMRNLGFERESPYLSGKKSRVWARGVKGNPGTLAFATRYVIGMDDTGHPQVRMSAPPRTN